MENETPSIPQEVEKPKKKQTTRHIKCVCPECGYVARITRKWINAGCPACPCGKGHLLAEWM